MPCRAALGALSGAKHTIYLQRQAKALPSTSSLDKKEQDFLGDVYDVLRASHYHLLNKAEWSIATSEDFTLNLPIEVNWNYMDSEMLSK